MRLQNLFILIILGLIGLVSFWELSPLEVVIFITTLAMLFQGGFSSLSMLYSFLKLENLTRVLPPRVVYGQGKYKYSLIVPARNEEKVIADTIKSMARINYPKERYEVLIIVRDNDEATKITAKKAIQEVGLDNIKLKVIDGYPINKAYSLNMGLFYASGDVVAVFDAEDEPHPDILKTVDHVFLTKDVDIVQAGIQLINVTSRWFSSLNCLEYYYWFKSLLPFFSRLGATPLGGNTVFFRKEVLKNLGGWSEDCLTEDADIGVRASVAGYKIAFFYVEDMATLEETPVNELAFIRQRARWHHGYLQILAKGDWSRLKSLREQFLSFYLLLQPFVHHFSFWLVLLMPILALGAKVRLWLALLSWMPLYFLVLQFGLYFLGLADLRRNYRLSFNRVLFLLLPILYLPYQALLALAFLRAIIRLVTGVKFWEKTEHLNLHRLNFDQNRQAGA